MCRQVLICLMAIAIAVGPMAQNVFSQESPSKGGNQQITSNPPQMIASDEVQLPKAKKSTGKYLLMTVLGVALVALAAGGGGGGGGDSNPSADDSGSVEVGW